MKKHQSPLTPALGILAGAMLFCSPLPGALAAEGSGSDFAFNEMVQEMYGRDTGSLWFDYYVEEVNQQLAARDVEEPYGAAGPSGPVKGFDGYLSGFVSPDTGSMWFDTYVDGVHQVLRAKGY